MDEKMTYKAAGVDKEAGYEAVRKMKRHAERTRIPGVLGGLGAFGGLFELPQGYQEPVLVSGTDGVGTKLAMAFLLDRHDTIGIDAVAMCVNDIVCQGAKPLFFLDYIGTGKLQPEVAADIVKGISDGCVAAGCALIGGETAEMPGFYKEGEYDIAGFSVGIAEKRSLITGASIREKDVLLGLPSSGIHSNGYSLVRKIFFEKYKYAPDQHMPELGMTLGEALLTPTRIYVKEALALMEAVPVKGFAHITGGGFIENIPRMLPEGLGALIRKRSFTVPPIFSLIQRLGNIEEMEMFGTFNMGIGLVAAVAAKDAPAALSALEAQGVSAVVLGEVRKGGGILFE